MVNGTVRVFLAEAVFPLTGLITAAFLTRRLGPAGYGLFTLVATVVTWVEGSLVTVFARATFKFVAEAEDWRPIGTAVVSGVRCRESTPNPGRQLTSTIIILQTMNAAGNMASQRLLRVRLSMWGLRAA